MAASILFLYMICTQSRQDSETIMARDGMHAPPEVEAKLAELKPDQTGTSRTEKPNQEIVPGHGPTFIKAVCTLAQRGGTSRAFEKYAFCVHETRVFKEMYRFAYTEWLVTETRISECPFRRGRQK